MMFNRSILKNSKSKLLLIIPLFFFSIFIGLILKQNLEMKKSLSVCGKSCVFPEIKHDVKNDTSDMTVRELKKLTMGENRGSILTARTAEVKEWDQLTGSFPNINLVFKFKHPKNLYLEARIWEDTQYFLFYENIKDYEHYIYCINYVNENESAGTMPEPYNVGCNFKDELFVVEVLSKKDSYIDSLRPSDLVSYRNIQDSGNLTVYSLGAGSEAKISMQSQSNMDSGSSVQINLSYPGNDKERFLRVLGTSYEELFFNILSTFELYQ